MDLGQAANTLALRGKYFCPQKDLRSEEEMTEKSYVLKYGEVILAST